GAEVEIPSRHAQTERVGEGAADRLDGDDEHVREDVRGRAAVLQALGHICAILPARRRSGNRSSALGVPHTMASTDSTPSSVTQLRLVVETDDYEKAVAFYRDVLGLPEREAYEGEDGARVAILSVPTATLEIANRAQVRMIDEVEVGRPVSRPSTLSIRVAFEVADAVATTDRLEAGGAEVLAPPTKTPWDSLNARLEAPGGLQITTFQELGSATSA